MKLGLAILLSFFASDLVVAQSFEPYSQSRSATNAEGTILAVASDDTVVRVWELPDGNELHQLKLPQPALSVALNAKGNRLLTGIQGTRDSPNERNRSVISCWSLQGTSPTLLWERPVIGGCQGLMFARHSDWVAAICVYSRLCFLDAEKGTLRRVCTENGNGFWDFCMPADESVLITAGQATRFWDLNKNPVPTTEVPSDYWPSSKDNEALQTQKPLSGSCAIVCHPNGREVFAVGWFEGTSGRAVDCAKVTLGSDKAPEVLAANLGNGESLPRCITFLPSQNQLAIGFDNGKIEFRSLEGAKLNEFQLKDRDNIRSILVVNSGKWLSIVNQDGSKVFLLDLDSRNLVRELK
jgi:hypothetical protein